MNKIELASGDLLEGHELDLSSLSQKAYNLVLIGNELGLCRPRARDEPPRA